MGKGFNGVVFNLDSDEEIVVIQFRQGDGLKYVSKKDIKQQVKLIDNKKV